MSLWEEAPARHSASPDSGRLWTIHAASSCSNISELAQRLIRNGSSGRTCPEYCRLNTDGLSSRSLKPWPNSGLMGGAAWRVLDAQFFGVAQRRERVFLVVNTRDWRRAAPVLFERESLCWDHPSSREKRKSIAGGIAGVAGNADANDGCSTPVIKAFKWNQGVKSRSLAIGEVSPTLSTEHNPAIYCYGRTQANSAREVDMSSTLTAHAAKDTPIVFPTNDERMTVRRLTPLECERLQGFPDGWTDIQWRGREHAPDGPRYKALGNSMAVPVMRWIGEGIQLVEDNKELFKKETTS